MVARITHLTALGNNEGADAIVGQIDGHVDLTKLADAGLLNEYTDEFGGVKRAAVVLACKFADFIAEGNWGAETRTWFDGVAARAWVVVVHNYEWESGLDG